MCYVSEYVRVLLLFYRGTPGLPVRHFNIFQLLFHFFFFFHFVSFGLLSFSIVICDRISTCIIQYSYINRATPTSLRLEHRRPSFPPFVFLSFFLSLLLRVNSRAFAFYVAWSSKSRRFCICVYRVSVSVYECTFKYILFFLFFFFVSLE